MLRAVQRACSSALKASKPAPVSLTKAQAGVSGRCLPALYAAGKLDWKLNAFIMEFTSNPAWPDQPQCYPPLLPVNINLIKRRWILNELIIAFLLLKLLMNWFDEGRLEISKWYLKKGQLFKGQTVLVWPSGVALLIYLRNKRGERGIKVNALTEQNSKWKCIKVAKMFIWSQFILIRP